MIVPVVYLDTTVFKFSATKLLRLVPKEKLINWGGISQNVTVYDPVIFNPNDKLDKDSELKKEADLLPEIAEIGKKGRLKFVTNHETFLESCGLPKMDSREGKFYDAPYDFIEAPLKYGRIVFGNPVFNWKDAQYNFLKNIKDKRFTELQKITGAYQGQLEPNRNQLLDAFHLWCAEHTRCTYFLTLDFKLIKVVKQNSRGRVSIKLIKPSVLKNIIKA